MLRGVRTLFQKIKSYLRITKMSPIARRYFIKNGFDGSMTVLGIIIGSWIVNVTQPEIVVTAGLGACVAMGVSGLFGAFMTERAERKKDLKILEAAMLTDLGNSIQSEASGFVSVYAAVIDGASPMLTAIVSLVPFILSLTGTFAIWDAYLISLSLTIATLFSLGIYLGRIAEENILLSGLQTVAAGLIIVVVFLLLGAI